MNRKHRGRIRGRWVAGLLLILCATGARADVEGVIRRSDTGQEIRGLIRWQPARKVYVMTSGTPPVSFEIAPEKVAEIRVQKPGQMEAAAQLVQRGQFQQAVPVLEKIVQDYQMLQWDLVALPYLARCYLGLKEPVKAVTACERAIALNPKALLSGPFASAYWDALIETEQYIKLDNALKEAIAEGERDLAALAQLKRGDLAVKQEKYEDALIDGYLRTIVFFQQEKEVLPEAMYKAIGCFEMLGQHARAEEWRKKLLEQFPEGPYAEKVRAGE